MHSLPWLFSAQAFTDVEVKLAGEAAARLDPAAAKSVQPADSSTSSSKQGAEAATAAAAPASSTSGASTVSASKAGKKADASPWTEVGVWVYGAVLDRPRSGSFPSARIHRRPLVPLHV